MSKKPKKTDTQHLDTIYAVRLQEPGIRACGQYLPGIIYKVGDGDLSNEEANRLVKVKGFVQLTAVQIAAEEKIADGESAKTAGEK